MKTFAFIFGIVLVAAILVATGYWLGFGQRFMTDAYSSTALDKVLIDASMHAQLLHSMDLGQYNDVRNLLRSELDNDVITIWAFGDYTDIRSRKMATNILARVEAFRADYPTNYFYHTSGEMADIDAKIASILEQARKAETR